jgi:RNA polymerase sigma-70 factor, ECF subfamily
MSDPPDDRAKEGMTEAMPELVRAPAPLKAPEVSLPPLPQPDQDSRIAAEVKALVQRGDLAGARDRFDALVLKQQRRASRIAYHFLRDAADADEAVQDAFLKVFSHIESFREDLPFEVWFTRILINGCLDRQKARRRRMRWLTPALDSEQGERAWTDATSATTPSPEESVLLKERRRQIASAVSRLPDRQRTIFLLCHYEGCSSREASAITGLNESTVRVHLFRAVRKLRALLGGKL